MNSYKHCPDCNSQDLQEITKSHFVTVNKGGCLQRQKTENVSYIVYSCRACGREFKDDSLEGQKAQKRINDIYKQ